MAIVTEKHAPKHGAFAAKLRLVSFLRQCINIPPSLRTNPQTGVVTEGNACGAIRPHWHPAMCRTGQHPKVLDDCQCSRPAIVSGHWPQTLPPRGRWIAKGETDEEWRNVMETTRQNTAHRPPRYVIPTGVKRSGGILALSPLRKACTKGRCVDPSTTLALRSG